MDNVHEELVLYTTDEKFYLVPNDDMQDALEIDRLNFEFVVVAKDTLTIPKDVPRRTVCALVGIIHLLAGPYLIVGLEKKYIGRIVGHNVYSIVQFDVIPFSKSNIHLSESQARDNQQYVAMVQRVLATPGFYISYTYDLSLSLQKRYQLSQTKQNFSQLSLYERADLRFVWNAYLLRDLVVLPSLKKFYVPLIHGFVEVKDVCTINGKQFSYALISRRSCHRAGVRYFVRGVNEDGHAANYVETEQLIGYEHSHSWASYVQTRGSIPLYWSQRPTLKYKPHPMLTKGVNHMQGLQKHFDEQIFHYGQQVVVNLIDQKGSEQSLGETFKQCVNSFANCLVCYDAFDFHKECSKMRWDKLSILINRLSPKQDEFGYFMMDNLGPSERVLSIQNGVFRTNCIDCLDRTNVVQSMLAHRILELQMQRLGVLAAGDRLETKNEFETTFKNVWADNGDRCSAQYTGTGALKADFTRTGKRTTAGKLRDGYNSIIRYYYNNFVDGFRQDAIDLFLGNYEVDRWEGITVPSPFHNHKNWKITVLPIVVLIAFSMLFISLIIPSTNASFQLGYILFWAIVVIATVMFIFKSGEQFTNSPKLVHVGKKKQSQH